MKKNIVTVLSRSLRCLRCCGFRRAQPAKGVEHWVDNGNVRLYVLGKVCGRTKQASPSSSCAMAQPRRERRVRPSGARETSYGLMEVLAQAGFRRLCP